MKKWKKVVKTAAYLFLVNQLTVPVMITAISSTHVSQIKSDATKVRSYKNLPKEFQTVDYFNLANMIVHNFSKGEGDCRDYTDETFNVYKTLLKQNSRKDLKNNIRFVVGFPKGKFISRELGHIWLEFKDGTKWKEYETVNMFTPKLQVKEIKEYSKESLEERTNVSNQYKQARVARSINGKKISYPLPRSVINGGLINLLYWTWKGKR